ncbi:MAG TPA: hypothetical protein VMC79_09405 [Rectinemataceae bacterium]|nr:hypothetical protein [Rectinemataceae bacterium]
MARDQLEMILDFILNKADDGEFEVIRKACERRVRDRTAFASLGGEGPGAMARRMANELQQSVGATMESVRATMKDFVTDIIRKNAPEISEEQLAAVLADYIPEQDAPAADRRKAERPQSLPSEALVGMVRSFVAYSEGQMPPSRQRELWESSPRWQEEYWAAFPAEVKTLVKGYLEGKLDGDTFGTALLTVLKL